MAKETERQRAHVSVSRQRRWPVLLLGMVLGGVGLFGAQRIRDENPSDEPLTDEIVAYSLVEVGRNDLVETVEWDAELGYGAEVSVSGTGGVVTRAAALGDVIERGDTLLEVDAQPVVVLYGDVPPYRTLSEGDSGADVQQLETNLILLGFDPDVTVTADTEFTANTQAMVERWQEAIGTEVDGVVEVTDVAVVPGPVAVRSAVAAGLNASGPVVTVAALSTVTDLPPSDDDGSGRPIETQEQSELAVTAVVNVSDADSFTAGDPVTVIQADDSTLNGVVATVDDQIVTSADGVSTVTIAFSVTNNGAALLEGPVVVETIGEEVRDAMTVPTRALVSLSEGGFAVEKMAGDSASLVGIEIGAFDDGLVEVVSVLTGTLEPGDRVVVPG